MKNIPYELIARYLAGECSDDEIQQVLEWSRQHPDLMDEFVSMWQQIPSDEFSPDVEQALQEVNQRIDTTTTKKKPKLFYMLAGSVAAAALIFILVNIIGSLPQSTTDGLKNDTGSLLALATGLNETTECELSDGSKVWLNQSSAIRYPETFSGNTREIYPEGEAFFDIAPDAKKPFIIHANNTQTRVVGTSFGIRAVAESNEVIVTVSTGIINFSTEGKSDHVELRQGEQGICKPEEQKLEKNTNPDPNYLAWKTKVMVFKQSTLAEVARVIEDVYHTPVTVDSAIADLEITSTFDQLSLDEVTQIIGLTLGVNIESGEKGININRSKE
ncbi:FecR domain-containing protein [Dysgonomonas sp. OttesenSCG-928-D17]|nr:FecR domain-containing protein [Dysgonomonas sp. OttesenSCG-928-D17]